MLVCFDLDGTLFDPAPLTVRAVRDVMQARGLEPPPDAAVVAGIGLPGASWYRGLVETAPGLAAVAVDDVMAEFQDRERELVATEGALFDGVEAMLDRVREMASAVVVCSNGYPDYVELVLRTTGIAGRFDDVWCGGESGVTKAVAVGEMRRRHGRTPGGHGAVVGDRVHDVEAAHANGLFAVGAAYGYPPPGELDDADAVAASPAEVPAILAELADGLR